MSRLPARRWLMVLALISVLSLSLAVSGSVGAQCTPRYDWPTYTVQPGDTLYRIALRYGTDSTTLAVANCLTDINRIEVGQVLRVPPTGVVVTPAPLPTTAPTAGRGYNLNVTYQAFERGFMLFRRDNAEISVYSGSVSGSLRNFPVSSYTNLPDNPLGAAPAGLIRPIFGFGKVWGNYPDIQAALGWAISNEQGYITTVTRYGIGVFDWVRPDTNRVLVSGPSNNRTWALNGAVVLPTPIPPTAAPSVTTTQASYQVYEGGFLIWEANTGNVVAFYNDSSYRVFRARDYVGLPDNPVLDPTPFGRVRPLFALGKVWGNYSDVRIKLGWALAPEQGWITTFRTTSIAGTTSTCFALPDGRQVAYGIFGIGGGTQMWYTGSC
ncbi:MAG: LysM peptidoglycan-binding domain-containing protein [Anaerolineae bacterium]|nr:LysM peptidoglycan-binding domain-containing protein [Anaerolineae bacterium]